MGWAIALGVLIGLLGSGAILLASRPSPKPIPIQVYVSGEVANTGVYALSVESRLQDTIEAARCLTTASGGTGLNLAFPLQDGSQIHIPCQQTGDPPKPEENPLTNTNPTGGDLVNINVAPQEELETLPGLGPVTTDKASPIGKITDLYLDRRNPKSIWRWTSHFREN